MWNRLSINYQLSSESESEWESMQNANSTSSRVLRGDEKRREDTGEFQFRYRVANSDGNALRLHNAETGMQTEHCAPLNLLSSPIVSTRLQRSVIQHSSFAR